MPFDSTNFSPDTTPPRHADHVAAVDMALTHLRGFNGWVKHTYENRRTGGRCLLGAVDLCEAPTHVKDGVTRRLCDLAGLIERCQLADWNDAPQRRKEDVLALLERARASFVSSSTS